MDINSAEIQHLWRRPLLVCPGCQKTERAIVACYLEGTKRSVRVDLEVRCSDCKFVMYEADEELIPQLQAINKHNIITHAHCAFVHGDKKSKMATDYGPYIIMCDIPDDAMKALLEVYAMRDMHMDADAYECLLDTEQESTDPRHTTSTKLSVVPQEDTVEIGAADAAIALAFLKNIVNAWMDLLDKSGINHPELHKKLRDIRITNYTKVR